MLLPDDSNVHHFLFYELFHIVGWVPCKIFIARYENISLKCKIQIRVQPILPIFFSRFDILGRVVLGKVYILS
jgi:hypothetical protein